MKTKLEASRKGGRNKEGVKEKKSENKAKSNKRNSVFGGKDKEFMKELESHLNSALGEIDDFTDIESGNKNLISIIKKATSELDKKYLTTVETVEWGRGKKYKEADKDMKTTVIAPGPWTCQQKYAIFTGNNSLHPNLPVKRRAVAEIQVIVFVLQNKEVLDHIKNVEAKEQFVMDLLEEVVGRA